MKLFTLCVCFYGALSFVDASFKWSRSYTLKAVLTIPAANLIEPYQVWLDRETGKSRVDFYDGIDKLYRQWDDISQSYQYFKIHPETTAEYANKEVCNQVPANSTQMKMYALNTYLPIKNFKFSHKETLNNIEAQKWIYAYPAKIGRMVKATVTYAVWITIKNSTPIPMRYIYELKADNMILDYFRHDYTFYDPNKPESSILQKPLGIQCGAVTKSTHEPLDPLVEFIEPSIERARVTRAFERFKQKHYKEYTSEDEHFKRMNIFKNNLRFINSFNRQHKSFSVAVNHFADRSIEELSINFGTFVPPKDIENYDKSSDEEEEDDDDNLNSVLEDSKENFDWRDYGAVTSVKDQTVLCDACYAFTTAAAIESSAYIARGCKYLDEVSEQAILDCSWSLDNSGNLGCAGGTYEYALKWVKDYGIPLKSEYGSYLAMEGLCHIKNMTKLVKINNYKAIPRKNQAIKGALKRFGPLLVSINNTPLSFYFYEKGVYSDAECSSKPKNRTHAVALIGYGKEADQGYWLIKNTAGESWGERGYMKIATRDNICGLKNFVYSVTFKKNKVDYCMKIKQI